MHVVAICSKLSSPSSLFCLPRRHLPPVIHLIVPGEEQKQKQKRFKLSKSLKDDLSDAEQVHGTLGKPSVCQILAVPIGLFIYLFILVLPVA